MCMLACCLPVSCAGTCWLMWNLCTFPVLVIPLTSLCRSGQSGETTLCKSNSKIQASSAALDLRPTVWLDLMEIQSDPVQSVLPQEVLLFSFLLLDCCSREEEALVSDMFSLHFSVPLVLTSYIFYLNYTFVRASFQCQWQQWTMNI